MEENIFKKVDIFSHLTLTFCWFRVFSSTPVTRLETNPIVGLVFTQAVSGSSLQAGGVTSPLQLSYTPKELIKFFHLFLDHHILISVGHQMNSIVRYVQFLSL